MTQMREQDGAARGVIVYGDTPTVSADEVDELANSLGWPVLAEPVAAPWLPRTFIAHAPLAVEKLLGEPNSIKPEVILAIGRVGLSRPLSRLLELGGVIKYWAAKPPLVSKFDDFEVITNLSHRSTRSDSQWLALWQQMSLDIETVVVDELRRAPFSGVHLARAVTEALQPGDMLHLGSSYPARDVEMYASNQGAAPSSWATGPLRVFMNRGVNGIDGVVSTAIGEALGCAAPSYLFCGDLTFLHDLNGLLIGELEPFPDLTIVVSDNNGGGIFSTLEHAGRSGFERVIATPLNKNLTSVVSSLDISVSTVVNQAQLQAELAQRPDGLRVVVVRVSDRDTEAGLRKAIRAKALS